MLHWSETVIGKCEMENQAIRFELGLLDAFQIEGSPAIGLFEVLRKYGFLVDCNHLDYRFSTL